MVKVIDGKDAEKFLEDLYNGNTSSLFGDFLANLKEKKFKLDSEDSIADSDKMKKIKISEDNFSDDNAPYHEPEWTITTKNLEDGKIATTIIVVAPFAVPKSICVKFDILEDKLYGVKIDYDNTTFPVSGGNIDLRKHDSLRIENFKRVDRKSVEITYNNGCYYINFCQVNNDKVGFTVGLSK